MRAKALAALVLGMVLPVLGAQGGIRLLADHADSGLLGWVPGEFAVRLSCYAVVTLAGVLLAGWGGARANRPEGSRVSSRTSTSRAPTPAWT